MQLIFLAILIYFVFVVARIVMLLQKNNALLQTIIERSDRQIDIMEGAPGAGVESTSKKRNPGALDRLAKNMAL